MTRGAAWPLLVRLGVVQAAIGAVVVLMTSTLNRVLIVELALPAAIPGALVALQAAVQFHFRPAFGFRSDRSGRRVRWIVGGMLGLALAGVAAAAAVPVIAASRPLGLALAALAFTGLGAGASAAGTPLLALVAEVIPADRRARAAAVMWLMMIAGFIVTTLAASRMIEPFGFDRLVFATAVLAAVAFGAALLATLGLEGRREHAAARATAPDAPPFRVAVRAVWAEPAARTFALFIFCSMLAYSAQDVILEPFGGIAFGLTPAESTRISSLHQAGMLAGMLAAAGLAQRVGSLRSWAALGCLVSAAAFVGLAALPAGGSVGLLKAEVLVLGVANGAFAIGAIGSMMSLSVAHGATDAGIRMGVFGAAQAVATAAGGFAGAAGSDLARLALGSAVGGYSAVFAVEALLFLAAAALALRGAARRRAGATLAAEGGDTLLAQLG